MQLPSSRTNCCLPEGVQFKPRFQCLVHFVLYLMFHVYFLRDLVSMVGRFFHSVQFLSVWKLPQLQLTIYSPPRYWWKSKQCRRQKNHWTGNLLGFLLRYAVSKFKATSLSTTDISSTNRYGDSEQPCLLPAD